MYIKYFGLIIYVVYIPTHIMILLILWLLCTMILFCNKRFSVYYNSSRYLDIHSYVHSHIYNTYVPNQYQYLIHIVTQSMQVFSIFLNIITRFQIMMAKRNGGDEFGNGYAKVWYKQQGYTEKMPVAFPWHPPPLTDWHFLVLNWQKKNNWH